MTARPPLAERGCPYGQCGHGFGGHDSALVCCDKSCNCGHEDQWDAAFAAGLAQGRGEGWSAAKNAAYLAILSVHDPIGCPPAVAALLGSQAAAIRALPAAPPEPER